MYKYLILLLLILNSCGGPTEEKPVTSNIKLPDELFGEITKNPISVTKAKSLKPGDSVVVKGKIMGSHKPFVANRASFIIGDPDELISCEIRHGDKCQMPWDTCCEPAKKIKAATLNIQLLDKKGLVYKTGLKNIKDLKELKEVVIEGKLDKNSTSESTIINAEKIMVIEKK
jgi:hypothetical protein